MKKCICLLICILMLLGTVPVLAEPEEMIDLQMSMTLTETDDGSVSAYLRDDRGGTVIGRPVSLKIDGEVVETVNTDSSGNADFDYVIPTDAQSVECVADGGTWEQYRFIGCTAALEREAGAIVTTTTTAQTPQETTAADTQPTGQQAVVGDAVVSTTDSSLVVAPLTTTVNETRVAVGVDVDEGVANAAQLLPTDFTSQARLWMDQSQYIQWASGSGSTLHLELTLNADAGAQEILVTAKNADPEFASYDDATVKGFAVNMVLNYVDGSNRVPLDVTGSYQVEIPVPKTMENSEKIAVAVCTADGLAKLYEVKPENGMLVFQVESFQVMAIVGFGEAAQIPWLMVAIIAGVVLIVAGVLLLVLVTFKRKKTASADLDIANDEPEAAEVMPVSRKVIDFEAPRGQNAQRDANLSAEDVINREILKARAAERENFARVSEKSVSPSKRAESKSVSPAQQPVNNTPASVKTDALTVDDLLSEVMSDLDNLNDK